MTTTRDTTVRSAAQHPPVYERVYMRRAGDAIPERFDCLATAIMYTLTDTYTRSHRTADRVRVEVETRSLYHYVVVAIGDRSVSEYVCELEDHVLGAIDETDRVPARVTITTYDGEVTLVRYAATVRITR